MSDYCFNTDPRVAELIQTVAQKHAVVPDIHPADFIFLHSLGRNPNVETVVNRYFDRGLYAADKLKKYIEAYHSSELGNFSLLDFASGYGCVARHHRRFLPPGSSMVCCDIHPETVAFIEATLGIRAVESASVPEELNVTTEFNVIFALSFFSHMPDRTWGRWFNALLSKLKSNGSLIFTTHGYESLRRVNVPLDPFLGYLFTAVSEQKDLDTAEYGSTIVSFDYVVKQIPPGYHLVLFKEAEWEGYQDVYIVKRFA